MFYIRKYFGSCVSCWLKNNTKKQTISTTHAQKSGKWIFYFNFVTNNGNQELQHTPLVVHKHSFIVLAIFHSSKYNNLQFAYDFGIIPVYTCPLFHFAVDPKPSQPTNQQHNPCVRSPDQQRQPTAQPLKPAKAHCSCNKICWK